jgi:hypothetical protein
MAKIADKVNEKIGKLSDKAIKDIYALFIDLALYILFFSLMYYEAIKIEETTKINNLQLLIIESFMHIPLYIFLVIAILMIPIFIDMWNEMVKRSKINKNNG